MKIKITAENNALAGEMNQSETAKAIYEALPIEATGSTWGDEIYFDIPVQMPAENATLDLEVGDLAYWVAGACFCIFYGRTPASIDDKPRPASILSRMI